MTYTDAELDEVRDFLKLHGGSCSVKHSGVFHRRFLALSLTGEVTLTGSSSPGYVNIYCKDFKPRFRTPSEKE